MSGLAKSFVSYVFAMKNLLMSSYMDSNLCDTRAMAGDILIKKNDDCATR